MNKAPRACFSANLEERLEASLAYRSTENGQWIAGCRGAGNAFVALLGPSPGAPDPGEQTFEPSDTRPSWNHIRAIGPNAGVGEAPFGRDNRRSTGWRKLFIAAFGGESPMTSAVLAALSAMWNLDWRHEDVENDTGGERLAHGASDILKVSAESKPRVIVTLTVRVAQVIHQTIAGSGLRVEYPKGANAAPWPYHVWFDGSDFPTLVLRSIRHPSYNTLNAERRATISTGCREFLRG